MTNFVTGKVENMTRLKELLKDKKVVAGVAAVIVLIAVGTTAVCVLGGNKNKQTATQETQQQTTATMEIAQAQTGAGETTTVATAVAEETKVENETPAEEAVAEAPQQAEPVEEAQPAEIPHREETMSENTGNDTEESNEPEEVEDTGNNEPEAAPEPEPTPEPATEATPSLTDEERLVATGKWELEYEYKGTKSYKYTDPNTGYTINANFHDGDYKNCTSNGPDEVRAIFDAHGIPKGVKMNIDTMLML